MPRRKSENVDEKSLTKGQLRKLNALRKSIGQDIGARAFGEWLKSQSSETSEPADKNAERIANVLEPLIKDKKLTIRRGGYHVKRGRGRVIVTLAAPD